MNFLEGTLTNANGPAFTFPEGNLTLHVSAQAGSRLASYNSKGLTLGIRPEHISAKHQGESFHKVTVSIEVTEPVGNEIFLYFTIPPSRQLVVCRIPSDIQPTAGAPFDLYVDSSKFHFFDPRTGLAL
jgi:ABC-type sugar transport system ATPase subunit